MRTLAALSTVGVALLSGYATAPSNSPRRSQDPSRFTHTRTFCTENRETHFENVSIELAKANVAPPAAPLYAGGNRPASTTLFIGGDAHWGSSDAQNHLNHPAPAAQFVVVLGGIWSVTTTDGETRRFGPGDVLRLEDTVPCKGHITVIGDKPGFLMFAR
jgi:hypothetical protein